MGVFTEILDQLEKDVEAVHGVPAIVCWEYNPRSAPDRRWSAGLFPCTFPDGTYTNEIVAPMQFGPSGEDPLRRLAELYRARAHLVLESGGAAVDKRG